MRRKKILTKKQKIGIGLIVAGIPGLIVPIIPGISMIICGILLLINHKLGTRIYSKYKGWKTKKAKGGDRMKSKKPFLQKIPRKHRNEGGYCLIRFKDSNEGIDRKGEEEVFMEQLNEIENDKINKIMQGWCCKHHIPPAMSCWMVELRDKLQSLFSGKEDKRLQQMQDRNDGRDTRTS